MSNYADLALPDRRRMALAGVCFVAVVALAGVLLRDTVPPLDRWIADNLFAAPGSSAAGIATAVSGVGTVVFLAGALVIVGLATWRSRPKAASTLARYVAVIAVSLLTILGQVAFQRSGPPMTAQDWTYPSGHVVFVSALALTAIIAAHRLGRVWRTSAIVIAVVALALVAASRLALGEHYLVDVLAALIGASGMGLLAAAITHPNQNPAIP